MLCISIAVAFETLIIENEEARTNTRDKMAKKTPTIVALTITASLLEPLLVRSKS